MNTRMTAAISKARALREAAGLSRIRLAAQLGISDETIRLAELGVASSTTILKIASALGVQPRDLGFPHHAK